MRLSEILDQADQCGDSGAYFKGLPEKALTLETLLEEFIRSIERSDLLNEQRQYILKAKRILNGEEPPRETGYYFVKFQDTDTLVALWKNNQWYRHGFGGSFNDDDLCEIGDRLKI